VIGKVLTLTFVFVNRKM